MPQHTYFIQNDPRESITVSWKFNWKNFRIAYQGQPLGEIENKKALQQGAQFTLPENRKLTIRLKDGFMPQLEILLDNEPVSGSPTDPVAVLKQVFNLSAILGALNLGLGILGLFWNAEFIQQLGFGVGHIIFGALILGLAFGIKNRSRLAVMASLLCWILDFGISIYLAGQNSTSVNPSAGLFMRIIIVFTLYRGLKAVQQLNQQQPEIQTV